ncbi:MAG: biotin/lipoyl-containing protein, partial [Paracoccaceae bacterium]|nr:biotin/lipoyl-containing protein [Paracoccaceae bacterium]
MTTEIRVPTLGESVSEATVATWFKKVGDLVAVDEMLCELETDKVTVEVPSPVAGRLVEIVAAEGATVGVSALLAQIGAAGEAAASGKPAAEKPVTEQPVAEKPAPEKNVKGAKAAASVKEGKMIDVNVPTLGESVSEATVSTWFKKVGDTVAQDEMLCELETDKVSVEVPSPSAGVLTEILAPEGTTVAANAKLAVISTDAAAAAPAAEAPAAAPATGKDVEDAPAAKKAMAEAGISRDAVEATGRDGRVMKEDVARAVAAPVVPAAPPTPVPAPAMPRAPVLADDAAREERVKMTRLRQTIARRLKDAQNTAAMLTTYNEVDMSGIMALRNEYKDQFEKKHKVKLGFMSFFVKACTH